MSLSSFMRYDRQIRIPWIGVDGQQKLGRASVLVAGAGGLGSVSTMYLAAAGIGRIVVVDEDEVEISNLNRQILHGESSLGMSKAVSARKRIEDLNSTVKVTDHEQKITRDTIDALAEGVDIIVDGSDNWETRVVLSRCARRQNIPWVFGGVEALDGMVSVFRPGGSPCFECVFPAPPADRDENRFILGPVAGMIASIQAVETVKQILGAGTSLENYLLRVSGLHMRITKTRLHGNPGCGVCSRRTVREGDDA